MTEWDKIMRNKRRHIIKGMAMKTMLEDFNWRMLIQEGEEGDESRKEFIAKHKALDKFLWEVYNGEPTEE